MGQASGAREWGVVAGAAIGLCLGFVPVVGFTFGVFLKAIAREFQWTRTDVSLAFSLSVLSVSVMLPIAGRLADRYGARRVIFPGVVLFGAGLAALGFLRDRLWQFYLTYVLIGVFGSGTSPVPYYKVISEWFDRRRGLAFGVAMAGTGIGSSFLPPFAEFLMGRFGWRQAYWVMSAVVVGVAIPVVGFLLKERPRAEAGRKEIDAAASGPEDLAFTPREALRVPAFWLMASSFFLLSVSLSGCLIHLVPMLTDRGFTLRAAALAGSVLGMATLVGRLGTGYLLDRVAAHRVALWLFSLAALGVLLLWGGFAGPSGFAAAFLVGLGMGAEGDVMAYAVCRYFGVRAFGEIYGYMLALYTVGAIVGPLAMAAGFDVTHSYRVVLGPFFLLTLAATGLMSRLGSYPAGAAMVKPAAK